MKSPLKGKYLIQNPLANAIFRLVDAGLSIWSFREKKGFPIAEPRKILLSNLAHLGDVVLMTALLPAIKKALPNVKIGVVVGSWAQKMVQNQPLIDHIHLLDHWKIARSSFSRLEKMKKTFDMGRVVKLELEEIQYDVSVECSFHFPNTIFLTHQANIPVRIGYTSGGFGPLLTHPVPWANRNESVARYALALIQKFADVDRADLKPVLPQGFSLPFSLPEKYLVIHMGSGNPIKEWPLEKWRKLSERLSREGHFLVFTGKGKREADAIDSVSKDLGKYLNLSDLLSWEQCISLVRGAQLLIAVDTGVGHVAAATATPAVLIYTGIHPTELWKPLSDKVRILIHPVPCHPCHLSRGCESMSCIRNVNVEEVYEAAQSALVML